MKSSACQGRAGCMEPWLAVGLRGVVSRLYHQDEGTRTVGGCLRVDEVRMLERDPIWPSLKQEAAGLTGFDSLKDRLAAGGAKRRFLLMSRSRTVVRWNR
jgi:hypothetical protein